MEIESTDYHDFVFRDGRLVGEFEQMYAKSAVAPWHQDDEDRRLDCRVALAVAETVLADCKRILEAGCGLGYFADLLHQRLPSATITGADVSPTAVSKASARFPAISFKVMDLKTPLCGHETYDGVVIRGCFWYLFDAMATVAANLAALIRPGGCLLLAQNFPPLDSPFIGKEVLPSPDALLAFFRPCFETVVDCRLSDRILNGGNDDWVIFAGRKMI